MKTKTRAKFIKYFKGKFEDREHVTKLYMRDMLRVSPFIRKLFYLQPEGVILVQSTEDVQRAYKIANQLKMPLIPRAGATTRLGGSIVYRKGIVVDLSKMNKITDLEIAEQSITVEPAVTFEELERTLNMQNLALCSYPSSIYSGSVGGWIANGGDGIGSLRYGNIIDQLLELEVVLPNGEVVKYTKAEDFQMFIGASGTTGIITKIKLRFRFNIPLVHLGCTFDNYQHLMKGIERFSDLEPYSIWFLNKKQVDLINKTLGFILPSRNIMIVSKEISYEEEEQEFRNKFYQFAREERAQILADYYIKDIWKARFKSISVFQQMQDYILGEFKIPTDTGGKFLKQLNSKLGKDLLIEGTVGSNNLSQIFITLPINNNKGFFEWHHKYLRMYKWITKAIKVKGFPSTTGLWFAGYLKNIRGQEFESKLKEFKKKYDPNDVSNPGKLFSTRYKYFPFISTKTLLKLLSIFA